MQGRLHRRVYSSVSIMASRVRGRGRLTAKLSASRASGLLVMSAMRSDSKMASSMC